MDVETKSEVMGNAWDDSSSVVCVIVAIKTIAFRVSDDGVNVSITVKFTNVLCVLRTKSEVMGTAGGDSFIVSTAAVDDISKFDGLLLDVGDSSTSTEIVEAMPAL